MIKAECLCGATLEAEGQFEYMAFVDWFTVHQHHLSETQPAVSVVVTGTEATTAGGRLKGDYLTKKVEG